MAALKTNPWVRFAARRLASLLAGVALLVVGSFMMVQLIPGDPVRRIVGTNVSPRYLEQQRARLGLDKPVVEQFGDYVSATASLDFGTSFRTREPVGELVSERLPKTLELATAATLIVLLIGIPLGLLMGVLTRGDRHPHAAGAFLVGTSTLAAVPEFVLGTFLVFLFAVKTGFFPVAGSQGLATLVLPSLAIALPTLAIMSRIVRVQTIDVLRKDYIRTARSKRLPGRIVYVRHTLPNVLTAALTVGGLLFMGLVGGTVVVENIFSWPGLGSATVAAIENRDYPVIQGAVLILGVLVLVVNTLLDVVLALLDPRSALREA
jgi:peptide/nickel transport system permease protein